MARLTSRAIRFGLANPDAWRVEVFGELASTNTLALERAAAGAPGGTVVLADSQTKGRGRSGREWRSPHGALAMSVLLRPRFERDVWPWLGLSAALSTRDAIEQVTGIRAMVKWPNDVLIDGRKVAGILLESRMGPSSDPDPAVVLGIGINVNNRAAALPGAYRDSATSLLDASGAVTDRNVLAAAVLNELSLIQRALPSGIERLRDRWRRMSATCGATVAVSVSEGVVKGLDQGLDMMGRLVVGTCDGERAIHTGDVLLCRAAEPVTH